MFHDSEPKIPTLETMKEMWRNNFFITTKTVDEVYKEVQRIFDGKYQARMNDVQFVLGLMKTGCTNPHIRNRPWLMQQLDGKYIMYSKTADDFITRETQGLPAKAVSARPTQDFRLTRLTVTQQRILILICIALHKQGVLQDWMSASDLRRAMKEQAYLSNKIYLVLDYLALCGLLQRRQNPDTGRVTAWQFKLIDDVPVEQVFTTVGYAQPPSR